jgi:tricorn protease
MFKHLGTVLAAWLLLFGGHAPGQAKEAIRLAANPGLSPDGATLAFDWNGDIWSVPITGGTARQLTQHPGRDREPRYSPDGKEIAFTSDRDGNPQLYVIPATGGVPKQLTFHSGGYALQEWAPDGKSLLVQATRDHFWRHAERLFLIARGERTAEHLLFDDYGSSGTLSPDGKRLLFTREGEAWWRKGYKGSQASQVWLYDLDRKSFTKVLGSETGCRWPMWRPDGKAFFYVGAQSGTGNLWEYDLDLSTSRQLTRFEGDPVVFPCIARDGSAIVFRQLFDFYRYHPAGKDAPKKIEIFHEGDRVTERRERRVLQTASQVAFTGDGLEVAFTAGGDLWIMDTELREPRQVTTSAEEERFPVFAPDGESILFVSDAGGKNDLWKAERSDPKKYWWQNKTFKVQRLTDTGDVRSGVKFSPDGTQVAFIRGRGDLWVTGTDGKGGKRLLQSFDAPDFDWSPDGKWVVYAQNDNDFNRDIWLVPADGSARPYNLSRHPYNERNPVWSPDGKVIAFTGQRPSGRESTNISFVWLRAEDDERSLRDRSLEKALDKMNKGRNPVAKKFGAGAEGAEGKGVAGKKAPVAPVVIDFDRLHERVRRVSLGSGTVGQLFWSPDSKKLAFTGTVDGKSGTFTIDVQEDAMPKQLSPASGTQARWLRQGNQIVWLAGGVPSSLPATGGGGAAPTGAPTGLAGRGRFGAPPAATPTTTTAADAGGGGGTAYRFQALQEVDVPKKNAAVFDLCWRTMRDNWYDDRLGNKDWEGVRRKYTDMAAQAPDMETLTTVIQQMLGELNGSHLGFTPSLGGGGGPALGPRRRVGAPAALGGATFAEVTAHLGVRFQPDFAGPGLKVRDVIPGGPADHKKSRIAAGEVVVSIDGVAVNPKLDLTTILNGPLNRDVQLKVRDAAGQERDVTLRPTAYAVVRTLLYEKWVRDNRKAVEDASKGALGYLHISAMSMPSFNRFEEELYSQGAGKDGLVIDVRENGGGSTTDHLLTSLTQPTHAITVPRGGGPGYPQDRRVYATWNKPIVVLCNQFSFSNAEIFSHAIKTLKRGQVVGVPTAGGVISTGAAPIMDIGMLRLPTRGWFLIGDGQDMELNGAVPHHIVWPQPGEMPQGRDVQLARAVEVLLADVNEWRQRPQPRLQRATERQPSVGTK